MNIEQQKTVAKSVYDKLRLADPDCLLAGGAPRDWYFGEVCNDLDFYFCSTACTMSSTQRQLKAIGFENVKHIADPHTNELYKSMEGLLRIWECDYAGMKVQFIQLCAPQDRWKVVNNMDISICKSYCKPNDLSIVLHRDFKLTVASGIMFLKKGYDWEQKHAVKMQERFKGKFAAGTKEQAIDRIVCISLEGVQ
jgi:hypothetical protein